MGRLETTINMLGAIALGMMLVLLLSVMTGVAEINLTPLSSQEQVCADQLR